MYLTFVSESSLYSWHYFCVVHDKVMEMSLEVPGAQIFSLGGCYHLLFGLTNGCSKEPGASECH